MAALQRASYGYLLRHPVQLLLALLGIATGVAAIVAVDLANDSASKAFRLSMDAVTGTATHQLIGGPGGLDETLYTTLRVEHGVRSIAPLVEGYAEIDSRTFQVLGVDPFAEREFRVYTLQDDFDGTSSLADLLLIPGAVLLSRSAAADLGAKAGERVELAIDGAPESALIAGVFDDAGQDAQYRHLLVTDISTAQSWFGSQGRLTRIDVRLTAPADAERLRERLPPGVRLLSAAGRTNTVAEMSRAFTVNLTAMSLLALLIGVFLIYNSVSFAVMQRRTLISVLRALGLTRRGLFALILGEALVLGVVGATLGLVVGTWLGESILELVARSLNDLYFRITVTDVSLSSWTAAKGVIAGLLATVIAALLPAIEAASYVPRLGMQRASLERRAGALLGRLAIVGLLLVALVPIVLATLPYSLVAGLTSLFLLIFGLAMCIPLCVRFLLQGIAAIVGAIGGDLARLTVSGIGANLSRTGVAIVALSVAVSATIGVSIMVGSFRLAVNDWIGQTLQADFYVSPASGSLQNELADDLATLPGVADASTSRRVWLETEGDRTRLIALHMAAPSYAGIELLETFPRDVWSEFSLAGAVLVSESYAYRHQVEPGDVIRLPTDLGPRGFQIAATYRSYDAQSEAVIISRSIYDMFWDDPAIDAIGLYLADGVDPAGIAAEVTAVSRDRQALSVRSNAELRELSLTIFDRTFVVTNVLYWLAICVAVVGILAAMLALQMERSRELATLRALGVTRLQIGGMVTAQSALIGLLSGLFALPLGVLMARLLIEVINRRAFGWSMPISVASGVLWSALVLATGAALLAGLYPAWRAGRSQPALAMRED